MERKVTKKITPNRINREQAFISKRVKNKTTPSFVETKNSAHKQKKSGETKKNITSTKKVKDDIKIAENTSWGAVSTWYDRHLSSSNTYHDTLIYPNLLRLLGAVRGRYILDLACGQGIFSHRLASEGAQVVGVDLGKELIAIAQSKNTSLHNPDFFVSQSHDLYMIQEQTIDDIIISLAIQNIEKVRETFLACAKIHKQNGRLFIVMNHPAFRIPKGSRWGFDDTEKVQYRRVDAYLSETKIKMDMTPGSEKNKKYTYSFHRPLQYYSKLLEKSGYLIRRIEEWEGDRISQEGPRKIAEDTARKEIPLFLLIEAVQWRA